RIGESRGRARGGPEAVEVAPFQTRARLEIGVVVIVGVIVPIGRRADQDVAVRPSHRERVRRFAHHGPRAGEEFRNLREPPRGGPGLKEEELYETPVTAIGEPLRASDAELLADAVEIHAGGAWALTTHAVAVDLEHAEPELVRFRLFPAA